MRRFINRRKQRIINNTRKIIKPPYKNNIKNNNSNSNILKLSHNSFQNNFTKYIEVKKIEMKKISHIYSYQKNQKNINKIQLHNSEKSNDLTYKKDDDKILVIIACHTNNARRLNALNSLMRFIINRKDIDIIIINSKEFYLSQIVKHTYQDKCIKYLELDNNIYIDFGKWYYALINTNLSNYKFVTFINDSFFTYSNIDHFFHYTYIRNVDLFGYNDSNQRRPHYQSYLFSIKTSAIPNFLKMFNERKHNIKRIEDVVTQYELGLFDYFPNRDCFLHLTNFITHHGKNIFSNNDLMYIPLKNSGLLPFLKLKRLL